MAEPAGNRDTQDTASAGGGQPAEFVDTAENAPGAQATEPEPPSAEELEKGKRRSGEAPLAGDG